MKLPMQNYRRREVANRLQFLAGHHDVGFTHELLDIPRAGSCHRFIWNNGTEISVSAASGRVPTRSNKQKILWDEFLLKELGNNQGKFDKEAYGDWTIQRVKELEAESTQLDAKINSLVDVRL